MVVAVVALTALVPRNAPGASATSDSAWAAGHPCLLFTPGDLPALREKVVDGGRDDEAWEFIHLLAYATYANQTPSSVVRSSFGLNSIPNLGVVGWLEEPVDTLVLNVGRAATLYLAENYDPDYDEGGSGMRLRSLVLGYDLFFLHASPAERQTVLDEIAAYVTLMSTSWNYELFAHRPYLGNHSAMVAGPLGMAAVSLRGELDDTLLDDALAFADRLCERLIQHQFDVGGAYKEGVLYGMWTMRNLAYYFEARKRYDGFDYSEAYPRLRRMEEWLAFELLPEPYGYTNNLNESNYATRPGSMSTTCLDWAIRAWDSGLSRWLWERLAGEYGVDQRAAADKAATVLWHRPVALQAPGPALSNRALWLERGLYYCRTGWPDGAGSDDVVFSFYSGKFHGGHAQEDQNQFTLYGYSDRYAIDHGAGSLARQSEAHNMVLVDGAGQHHAGGSIGTDGEIAEYLLGEFADYLVGDATAAYSTYSEFNQNDHPFVGIDWSWGHKDANPVLNAKRTVLSVHGTGEPWFVIIDDIDKDGAAHEYQWRMHTALANSVDAGADPVVVTGASSALQIHALHPSFAAMTASVSDFDNGTTEPDSKLLALATTAVDPAFAFLLLPVPDPASPPAVTRDAYPWGEVVTIDRERGERDVLVYNPGGGAVDHDHMDTDATLAALRAKGNSVLGFTVVDATWLSYGNTAAAECANGPISCSLYNGVVDLGRHDADYRVADLDVHSVRYRDQALGFVVAGGYVVPDGVTAVDAPAPPPAVEVRAFPNPFNPRTTIRVRATSPAVRVDIYDVAGRKVRRLWRGPVDGTRDLVWNGRDHRGERVASGVYLVRVHAGTDLRAAKLILLK